jgi:hypothetical protein
MNRNRRLIFGLVLLVMGSTLHAQKATSLRQTVRALREDPTLAPLLFPDSGSSKCGTPTLLAIHSHWQTLAPAARTKLQSIMQRPILQASRLSPSGRFRIHYDTLGFNQPALIASNQDVAGSYNAYIDSVAAILDYVWTYEIDTLGYDPPPSDGNQGGGPEFDVYVEDLPPGLFGYTDWLDADAIVNGGNTRFPTFIVVDNDFLGLRTPGMNGLKVTCAHEFHHAIQIGAYGMWSESDFYFNELTSSWMEDVVYTQINDYYYDVVNYFRGFRNSQGFPLPFTYYNKSSFAGYERCIWGHFLAKRYGRAIMKEIWTDIRVEPFLQSARDVFAAYGTSWNTEFALFTYWNYFTGDRADTVRFYPEGNHYPRFTPNFSTDFSSSTNSTSVSAGAYPLSSAMFDFHLASEQDTLTAVVANTDIDAAMTGDNAVRQLKIDLSKGLLTDAHVSLANGYNIGISVADGNRWRTFYLLASTQTDIEKLRLQASPNPFRVGESSELSLPLATASDVHASVYFLTSSLTMAYSGEFSVKDQFGSKCIVVPSGQIRSHLSSGIYFVVARIDGSEYQWKVAIIQ